MVAWWFKLVAATVMAGVVIVPTTGWGDVGHVYDVDKDGRVSSLDADAVTEHINLYGNTDIFDDFLTEFDSYDNSLLEAVVESLGPVEVIHSVTELGTEISISSADLARLWYHAAWARKDVKSVNERKGVSDETEQ